MAVHVTRPIPRSGRRAAALVSALVALALVTAACVLPPPNDGRDLALMLDPLPATMTVGQTVELHGIIRNAGPNTVLDATLDLLVIPTAFRVDAFSVAGNPPCSLNDAGGHCALTGGLGQGEIVLTVTTLQTGYSLVLLDAGSPVSEPDPDPHPGTVVLSTQVG